MPLSANDHEILDRIVASSPTIDCPECECICDEQYTCTTCWGQGGDGQIDIVKWLKENPDALK